jgi:hypothetical protein
MNYPKPQKWSSFSTKRYAEHASTIATISKLGLSAGLGSQTGTRSKSASSGTCSVLGTQISYLRLPVRIFQKQMPTPQKHDIGGFSVAWNSSIVCSVAWTGLMSAAMDMERFKNVCVLRRYDQGRDICHPRTRYTGSQKGLYGDISGRTSIYSGVRGCNFCYIAASQCKGGVTFTHHARNARTDVHSVHGCCGDSDSPCCTTHFKVVI